jgi:hypothetical protein
MIRSFNHDLLSTFADTTNGFTTGDNNLFLRQWYEVKYNKIGFNISSIECAKNSGKKWFPYNKGGAFRKWYGNNDNVINWENDGYEIKHYGHLVPRSLKYMFKEALTWGKISSGPCSFRYKYEGNMFDVAGLSMFLFNKEYIYYMLGLCNTKYVQKCLEVFSPTLNYETGHIANIPVIINEKYIEKVTYYVKDNVNLSKTDWDSFETSWDFTEHPLVRWAQELWDATAIGATIYKFYGKHIEVKSTLELCYLLWQGECQDRFNKLKANEEELNRIFIDIYGLQDEFTPEVEDKDVTVRLADMERDIKSLISYFVGVVMGRYSLSTEGLVYTGGEWNEANYLAYKPDEDGIIPIYSSLGMEDGLTSKIIDLVKKIFGEDDYRNNIDFIAEALGKKQNESSEETLNRYLNEGFYSDHLKIYQKRPIYWMFSSGKNSGFKCLIYMHRYNADTLAAINGKYFLPESTRIKKELDEINSSNLASEGKERIRLEKERQKLATKYNETIEYGLVLDHMANKYIEIDLDDGVKVNYEKFQGVELVSDNGTKIKKDLLVPIK